MKANGAVNGGVRGSVDSESGGVLPGPKRDIY